MNATVTAVRQARLPVYWLSVFVRLAVDDPHRQTLSADLVEHVYSIVPEDGRELSEMRRGANALAAQLQPGGFVALAMSEVEPPGHSVAASRIRRWRDGIAAHERMEQSHRFTW